MHTNLMLTMRQIELFRAVMIAGTISGAARMLDISQPGISRVIAHMEDKVRFRLFDRTRGRLIPTHEAQVLFEQVRQIYDSFGEIDNTIRRLAKGDDRTFRVAASPSLGHSVVPAMLARLTATYPGLRLQFDILSVDQAHSHLASQSGEYALTLFHIDHPNVLSSRMSAARLVCAMPTDHPLADRGTIGVADIADEPLLSFPPATPHGQAIARLFADAGAALETATYVRFAETAVAFVAQGMGLALVDSFTAMQPHADNVRFVEFDTPSTLPVYLSRHLDMPRAMIGETFEEIVRKVLLDVPRAPKAVRKR